MFKIKTSNKSISLEEKISDIIKKNIFINNSDYTIKANEYISIIKENDEIIINNKKYKLCYFLGDGSYGTVWKIENNNNYYAVKFLKYETVKGELIHQEISNYYDIIKGYGIYKINNINIFLMDLGYKFTIYDFRECFFLMNNILTVLLKLNEHNIIHNDIKPNNILKKNNGIYSLIDFNLCSTISNISDNDMINNFYYKSYNLLINYYKIDYFKCDIWALGCTIYTLYKKELLFKGNNLQEQIILLKNYLDLSNTDKFNFIFEKLFGNNIDIQDLNKKYFVDLLLLMINNEENILISKNLLNTVNQVITKIKF
tara:strand:+ start:276 stop:1217 length:942 start_codon:yes stop_codon:yes gene_type:complete